MVLGNIIDLFMHLDTHLQTIISNYGVLTYLILFFVIFLETGLVITPFLPGDSLLFAAGAFAALGSFNIFFLIILLCIAAISGDTLNYWVGNLLGEKALGKRKSLINQKYLSKTQAFYNKHGGKTIILARFIPIIRTFAPFIAGIGKMKYSRFLLFNIVGGIVWVSLFTTLGYLFGNISFIKERFSLIILAIIILSVLPIIFQAVKEYLKR